MSELIAVAYPEQHRADEVLETLKRLQVDAGLGKYGGTLLHTSPSKDTEVRLQSALDAGRACRD